MERIRARLLQRHRERSARSDLAGVPCTPVTGARVCNRIVVAEGHCLTCPDGERRWRERKLGDAYAGRASWSAGARPRLNHDLAWAVADRDRSAYLALSQIDHRYV